MQDSMNALAVKVGKVETEIETHKDECARRYAESREMNEKILVKLEELTGAMAQAKGMGTIAKWLVCSSPFAGFLGGVVHHSISKN